MEILKVVEPIVLSKAVKLANVWAREFMLACDYSYTTPQAQYVWCVYRGANYGTDHEIILRRSAQGYWVELFKDGLTVRSVEVTQ